MTKKTMGTPSMWWLRDKGSHKVVQTPVAFELYDLKKDPMEMKNVANDPEYKRCSERYESASG